MMPPLSFLLAALLLAIIPGPGIAFVVAQTVAAGRRQGLASSLGTALGGMLHVCAAAAGLSLLIAQSPLAFAVVKYLGAAYLLWLGYGLLRKQPSASADVLEEGITQGRALCDGVLVEVLNIKTAMFFLAFIPQFVDIRLPLAPQFLLLGSVCVLFNTMADVLAVLMASRFVAAGVGQPGKARLLSRLAGLTMLSLGLLLALSGQYG